MNTLPTRKTIVNLCVELSRRGYLAGTGGNIAIRVNGDHFAVTPSATDYLAMDADDICVLRLQDLKQVGGARTPSVESGLHANVLRARPDVACSIHTHQPTASACALLGQPLDVPIGKLRTALGARVPIVGYAPSGTKWLSSSLAKVIRPDCQAYLMFNHGVLCCGRSTEEAVTAVDCLEELARIHLGSLMTQRSTRQPHLQSALRRVTGALEGTTSSPRFSQVAS